eukprot:Opistho-2@93492
MLYPSLSACIRDTWLQNRLSVDPLTESQCQFNWTLQGYIAPETLHDGRCSAASDLYGLGVAAHEMYMKACRLVRDETDEWRVFLSVVFQLRSGNPKERGTVAGVLQTVRGELHRLCGDCDTPSLPEWMRVNAASRRKMHWQRRGRCV